MVERTVVRIEDDRTGSDVETLKHAILDNLYYVQGKFPEIATDNDWYMAVAYTVRDRLLQRWISTFQTSFHTLKNANGQRLVGYLSAEYLLGPHLVNNALNMEMKDNLETAVREMGLDFDTLVKCEEEPGLGNGGLGRLAACYMDSLSTLEIPAIGYGIRYEFGIFDQVIQDGWQVEVTDKWLKFGNPWEIPRWEASCLVKIGGKCHSYHDETGRYRVHWTPERTIRGIPYDTPIPGYRTNTANTLRLWKAEAPETFDLAAFNTGDYMGAVTQKMVSENVSKVLYPSDDKEAGKKLRLEQQYFFVSCSLQDIINLLKLEGGDVRTLHKVVSMQLNDTHPSIAVAELMRILIDDYNLFWDESWEITKNVFSYTNHTLLPEALERWPLELFGSLLPRHLDIIMEINRRFLEEVKARFPGDDELLKRVSLIDETAPRYIRMAHLAVVGSHAVNGVAELHTELLKKDVLGDFYKLYPEKFCNVTNGVTPRRWMLLSNPRLSNLITSKIGSEWPKHLEQLRGLEKYVDDAGFREEWLAVKAENKRQFAETVYSQQNIVLNPDSLFDVQVKRIHEYKRQHLNVLHIITLYNRLKNGLTKGIVPRTFVFGGKAAPGYFMAKRIIKLINSVADVVNNDPVSRDLLKVIFLPDYKVSVGQQVYPMADLSEQISTAGKEASGTGNMKFSLNGALTIGTLDGANVEIRQCVGAENFFLFGMTAEDVYHLRAVGYNPRDFYEKDDELREAIDSLRSGVFSRGDIQLFQPIVENLLYSDPFMLLADYRSYVDCQSLVSQTWADTARWTKMSILNSARCGMFSSDRAIDEYCNNIWRTKPISVDLVERTKEYCLL